MAVRADVDTCIGRGVCVGVYPTGALNMNDDGKSVCDGGTCIGYGSCVSAYPVSATSQ